MSTKISMSNNKEVLNSIIFSIFKITFPLLFYFALDYFDDNYL